MSSVSRPSPDIRIHELRDENVVARSIAMWQSRAVVIVRIKVIRKSYTDVIASEAWQSHTKMSLQAERGHTTFYKA